MSSAQKYINLLLTIVISLIIGAVIIALIGENPAAAYLQLLKGAFVGKLNFGTTLQMFTPLLLTSVAFVVSSKVGVFNVGVEGELYLGAIAAAWAGYNFTSLPGPIHILLCFGLAMLVGALWAWIPAVLKANWRVNEVCVTILMNYVAMLLTSYLVNGPFSAKTGVPQTPSVAKNVTLAAIMKPSQANTGLFIGIIAVAFIFWLMYSTTVGYKLRTVGMNQQHAAYIGINPKNTIIMGMMISGCIGGLAGCIETLGVYGYFLDNFSAGIAFNGMLAALIVKNDLKMIPVMSFFFAALGSGALGMDRFTGVPKSIVDTIVAVFIIFACMEGLFQLNKKYGFFRFRKAIAKKN